MPTNPSDPSQPSIIPSTNLPNPNALPPAIAGASPAMPPHHRRSKSDFVLRIPDDLRLSSGDPMAAGSFEEIVSEDDLFSTYMDMEKIGCKLEGSGSGSEDGREEMRGNAGGGRAMHRHSNSVDSSSAVSSFGEMVEAKKAMTTEQLAELAAVDPKRAKRILANRQSAARSKERKARYISDLERRVQTLQTEATALSAHLNLYQRDTSNLTAENAELKLRLQTMEQQAHLRDALNEALKNEVERLQIATGEATSAGEANKAAALNPSPSLPFSPSFFPVPGTFPHQSMPLPLAFHPPPLPPTNLPLRSFSHHPYDAVPHDHLGRLRRLDISRASPRVKSESTSISADESSCNF